MTEASVTTMSMYSELLAMSLKLDDDATFAGTASERRLLEELTAQRDRLEVENATASERRSDAPSRVATEIQYDRALIKLCRLHEIPCDVSRFTRPSRERRRLEEALESVGVDLRDQRRHRVRHRIPDQEPPEGS